MIGLPHGEKNCDDMLSRFHSIPGRYGRTDRRTDGRTELLYQYRASLCWHVIKTIMLELLDCEKTFEDICNRLHTIPAWDERTDGQTDRQTDGRTDRRTSCHGIVRAMHMRRAVKTARHSNDSTLRRSLTKDVCCTKRDHIWNGNSTEIAHIKRLIVVIVSNTVVDSLLRNQMTLAYNQVTLTIFRHETRPRPTQNVQ